MKRTVTPFLLAGALILASGSSLIAQSRTDVGLRRATTFNPSSLVHPGGAQSPFSTMLEERGGGYCAAGADGTVDIDLDERIVNVTFAGINNSSADAVPVAPAYTFYPSPTGSATIGQSYPIAVNVNRTGATTSWSENQVIVWIDLNQDQDFNDPNETVFTSTIGSVDIYSGNMMIPPGSTPGATRMRVRLLDTHDGSLYENVLNNTPCGSGSFGEVEDYVVNIVAAGGAPANDLCANATPITSGASCVPTNGNMQGATQSLAPATCSTFLSTAANDVWFTFTATGPSSTVAVGGGGDASTGLDPILEIFSGNCGALNSLGCMDSSLRGGVEALTVATTPGVVYLYRIYYWNYAAAQTVFDYATCVVSTGGTAPANDACANVTPSALAIGGSIAFNGDNSNAIPGGDGVLDVGGDTTTVWHAITITACANLTVAYCGTITPPAVSWASIYGGCPASNTNVVGYSDYSFTVCGDNNLTLYYNDLPAGTYYIPVRGEPATAGPYTLTVSAVACVTAGAYCTASATNTNVLNEKISNVTVANINNSSTLGAGYEDFTSVVGNMTQGQSYPITITLSNGFATDEARVWIDFDHNDTFDAWELVFTSAISAGPFTGTVNVPAGALLGNTRMRVRMHDTYALNIDYTNVPNATPCGTSTYGQVEDYTINISGGGPVPPNDLCGNVNASALSIGGNVNFTGDNSNATSTGDYVVGSDFDPMDPTVWHAFTTSECANVVVSYCNTAPAFENVWIFLTQSCPVGNDYVLGAYENTSCAPNFTVSYYNLPAGTWYVPVLLDVAAPGFAQGPYSINVSATACASAGNYCTAGASQVLFEKISNVAFNTIDNTSTSAAGFEDFTAISTDVVGGQSYDLTVTVSGGYATDQVLAWVDWNQNSVFDGGELVFASPNGMGPHTGTVTVPLTAVAGPTRMRVRLHDTYLGVDYFNTPNATPCDTSRFGQVEDYTVNMIGVITGIDAQGSAAWGIYPNPNDGNMVIRFGGMNGKVLVEVIDVAGRTVHSDRQSVSQGAQMPLSLGGQLSSGTYVVRLTTDQGREERRMVVR